MASRILVSLGEERTALLDQLALRSGQSRAAMIRMAVDNLIEGDAEEADRARRKAALEAGFGLWKHRADLADPADYERRRRAEWTRYWDDDYEEVRAESPDVFDAEDDRQRQIYLDMIAGRYPSPKSSDAS